MLHPTLGEDYLPKSEKNLPPGFLTLSSMFSEKADTKRSKRLKVHKKFYSTYKKFKKLPPSNFDVPCITNASPYISEEELYRKSQVQGKKRFVSSKNFKLFFGKATTSNNHNFIPNYVTITPSDPPLLHKFRAENRKEWMTTDQFKF